MVVNAINIFSSCPTEVVNMSDMDSDTSKLYARKVMTHSSSKGSNFISYCNDCCGTFGKEVGGGRCPFCGSTQTAQRSSSASRDFLTGISRILTGSSSQAYQDEAPFGRSLEQAA